MGNIYVKAVEPCIFDDLEGNVVDMSHTEFYGDDMYRTIDKKTGEVTISERKANPGRVFQVVDSKYWLELITGKRLIGVEKPKEKAAKRGKSSQEETNEETID